MINQHVPVKKPKKKKALWLTRKALKAVRRKQRAWRKYQKRKTAENKRHYEKCQTDAKRETRIAKRDFERKIAENIKTDPKSFYSYVRSKQKVKDAVGPLKNDDGETLQPGQETADALNNFLTSVFTKEDSEVPTPVQMYKGPEDEKLTNIKIDEETVKKKLEKLDPSKAAGPDDIPPSLLKNLADELCTPITLIFNKSIEEGLVPEDWRTAHITPIFKKGSRSKPGNYRPISLTSVIGKVLESIFRDHITDHLDQHNLIADTQHGFRKGKSCTTNLLDHLEALTKQVDEGIPVDVVYLDLAKAFDTVPHRRLLAKIRAHGIDGRVARWIEAWLEDRKQRVITQGATSNWEQVTSSVVQGSVLGPLCFLIYMNDMEEDISPSSKVSKFADDTKLSHPVPTQDDIKTMQKDIDQLQTWADKWQMRYNVGKCGVMHTGYHNPTHTYTMGNTPLR